ncbi:MAG: FMN-binding protein [Actinomycetota bacterium]
MIRTTVPTPIRTGAALVGVAGMLVLAGCSGGADTAADANTGGGDSGGATTSGEYTDGTYTAEGSYQTPETLETVSVTLALEDGVVTEVEVTGDPQAPESQQYQGQFIGGIEQEVVGVSIDELNVDRVAGSSLTSGGFNSAVEAIKEQAAA